ncbi:hypothetical protein Vadar_000149 [Vaccinium darrowii]|uniref:Uncharacterized protein n=1 Tax=Vaccinium darrowii TaxID=229202 RepID=A0ACB7WW00_9ERIC|nr:hypothetical protein Vadar_000149 [Vaccinium darrowii]
MAGVPNQDPQVPLQDPQDSQFPDQERENPRPKKSKGRQKVNMAKMENENNLQVTFSKRRFGLFKKASELVTLCGIELALIVFSPGNKAFSFGHPSVDNIIDRFLTWTLPLPNPIDNIVVAQRNENVRLLNMQLTNAHAMLEVERRRGLEIDHARVVRRNQRRWEAPIEELSRDELLQFKAALETLKVNVAKEVERLMQEQQQNPSAFQTKASSFGGGGGSSSFGGSGFSQFLDGSSSFGGGSDSAFSTGLNYFGDVGSGVLPFSTGLGFLGASRSSVPPFFQFSTGPSSVGVGGTLPFSTWSAGGSRSSTSVAGALPFPTWSSSVGGNSGFSGALPPFPGEVSSSGHCGGGGSGSGNDVSFHPESSSFERGSALPFPPERSSFRRGGALQFPPGPSLFGRGDGSGSGSGGDSAMPPIGPSSSGRGRGRPSGSRACGRGSNHAVKLVGPSADIAVTLAVVVGIVVSRAYY